MNDNEIETEIQSKGLTAPRLTPEQIDATIAGEAYHVFAGSNLTVCCLTLRNGFTVTGESACVSAEKFDAQLGRKIARGHARDKIWQLEGYLLRDRLKENVGKGAGFARASGAGSGSGPRPSLKPKAPPAPR